MIYIKLETINEDSGRTCVEVADDKIGGFKSVSLEEIKQTFIRVCKAYGFSDEEITKEIVSESQFEKQCAAVHGVV